MQWQTNYWGIQYLAKSNGSTIKIPAEEYGGKEGQLTRLETWEAERVLGIRLPMDGTMNTEYNYRNKQMDTLSHSLYHGPFTPKDAYMIYNARYKAMIKYPLPITQFTTQQLDNIQKNSFTPYCQNLD